MAEFKFPTEEVELPSKGLVYPEENPLSSGKVELKYMTAKEEDILTNQNYIAKGTVIDKLLKSLIVSKEIKYTDLIVGDKNALIVASRILGYGKDYKFTYLGEEHEVDLSTLENKKLDETLFSQGKNEFEFTLPHSNTPVTFKILDEKDEQNIQANLKGYQKINKENFPEITTRLKYIITSIDGERGKKEINEFVDNYLLARDSKALRDYLVKIQPDVHMIFEREDYDGNTEEVDIPIGVNFFFPDA